MPIVKIALIKVRKLKNVRYVTFTKLINNKKYNNAPTVVRL